MKRIEFKNLAVGYNDKSIGQGWQGTAQTGDCIALIGLNGAGKSTLMRTLSGLQAPLNGEVYWDAKALPNWSIAEQARFRSTVLTEKLLPTQFTVQHYVELGCMPYLSLEKSNRMAVEENIHRAMQLTGIAAFSQRYLHQLSDGQLQRTHLARALAQDTPVLFLDEPFAHLDISQRAQIWQLLYDLTRKAQKTILFSLHDLDLGWEVPTGYWLIHQEKLLTYTPEELENSEVLNQVYATPQLQFDAQKRAFELRLNR